MNKKRIMIVDDEAPFTRLLKLTLEQTGHYAVCVENSPDRAVGAAREFHPDLILLDVMMPGIDGGDLAARFQDSVPLRKVPIVFLTAAVRREEVQAHQGLIGGLPFLAKPVDLAELTRCIQQHLGAPDGQPELVE
jgi:CheY-like chemotaxis protein